MDFFRFLRTRRFLRHLLGVIMVVSILVSFILLMLNIYTQHARYLILPDFAGKTLSQVTSADEFKDYEFLVVDSVFDPGKPKGTILRQDPYPASKVKKNRKIYLTIVSFFPEKTSMPDLKYLTLRQALSTRDRVVGAIVIIVGPEDGRAENGIIGVAALRSGGLQPD